MQLSGFSEHKPAEEKERRILITLKLPTLHSKMVAFLNFPPIQTVLNSLLCVREWMFVSASVVQSVRHEISSVWNFLDWS